jgi:hypothetical protein
VKSILHRKEENSKEGSNTFMSNINCQELRISVEKGRGDNNMECNQTLNILFSVAMRALYEVMCKDVNIL